MILSIIIPAYNSQEYIEQCLKSVQACPFEDMEYIIVNDGSTDGTLAICEKIQKEDKRCKVVTKENAGVSAARNTGIQKAQGKWIFFLDGDDYFTDFDWNALYKDNEETDFAAYSYITLFEDGKLKGEPFHIPEGKEVWKDYREVQRLMFASSKLNMCWGKLFLREIIEREGILFDENLSVGEDFKFVAQYFMHCSNPILINKPLIYYRQHGNSAMHRYSIVQRLEFTDILLKFSKDLVKQFQDRELENQMYVYYFRVLTNLLREFSGSVNGMAEHKKMYEDVFKWNCVKEIITNTKKEILPSFKKIEYQMCKKKSYFLLTLYFEIKRKL